MHGRFGDGSERVIAAMIEVHRSLGPGLLESIYERCLAREFELRGILFEQQQVLPVRYKDVELADGYRLDFIVEGRLLVELKAVEKLLPVHRAQLVTYLKLSGFEAGLLVNFNVRRLKEGLERVWLPPFYPSSLL